MIRIHFEIDGLGGWLTLLAIAAAICVALWMVYDAGVWRERQRNWKASDEAFDARNAAADPSEYDEWDAEDVLLDVRNRAQRANTKLLKLADAAQEDQLNMFRVTRLTGKAEGVRLVMGYVDEALLFIRDGADPAEYFGEDDYDERREAAQ